MPASEFLRTPEEPWRLVPAMERRGGPQVPGHLDRPSGRTFRGPRRNGRSLAVGGSGDVLAGLAGLLARGVPASRPRRLPSWPTEWRAPPPVPPWATTGRTPCPDSPRRSSGSPWSIKAPKAGYPRTGNLRRRHSPPLQPGAAIGERLAGSPMAVPAVRSQTSGDPGIPAGHGPLRFMFFALLLFMAAGALLSFLAGGEDSGLLGGQLYKAAAFRFGDTVYITVIRSSRDGEAYARPPVAGGLPGRQARRLREFRGGSRREGGVPPDRLIPGAARRLAVRVEAGLKLELTAPVK
ncbi:MAG: hypothetical protein MZU97_08170 [Bacillus subtilis]|nr:hypothetical protein [Bacillus subtilis]